MESCNVELIFDHVGHFGKFQIILYLICAYQNVSCGIHYLASVFMLSIPEHACKPPGNIRRAFSHNLSAWRLEDILALRSPDQKDHITVELQSGEIWELTRCNRTWRENKSHLVGESGGYGLQSPCSDGYVYDQSRWRNSLVEDLNLVCERKWYAYMIQPLFISAVLLGSITFGYLSDRFGRRMSLWCTSIGVFFFGIASIFIFDYFSFMAVRFFLTMAASGYFVVVIVYVMEIIGKKSRTWASVHLNTFFAIGVMLVALVSSLVNTWWLYQVILCTVTAPFILCCWMLPETPLWLISEGRYKEAQGVINTMAVWNKSSPCDLAELLSLDMRSSCDQSCTGIRKLSLADLFHDWDVSKRTLIVWLVWFTTNFGYYIFFTEAVRAKENQQLYLFLVGATEIPVYFFICVCLDRMGRRYTVVSCLLLASLFTALYVAMPLSHKTLRTAAVLVLKTTAGSTFAFIFIYTAELYPTIVRCLAVGSSSTVARIASIIIPFINQYWIVLPQILFGILAVLSGLLSLNLPETLNKPLASTWEKTKQQAPENKDGSGKAPPTAKKGGSGEAPPTTEKTEMKNTKKTWVWFPALAMLQTTLWNSGSTGPNTLFPSPWALHASGADAGTMEDGGNWEAGADAGTMEDGGNWEAGADAGTMEDGGNWEAGADPGTMEDGGNWEAGADAWTGEDAAP
ncbi:solute carrier family 22 member 16 [Arvicola amphibius]|uniref:solute carrier family 22 member 16 n=1 Tax=Arvicola amphibius TaxID=1047088 RepID=UPI001C099748|nr:solute carrier family 22 member 16 [Arvicola amphibius]